MNELLVLLEELINLNKDEIKLFSSLLERKVFKPKDILVKEGQISKSIYFIESGLLRTYHLQNGKEINSYFACNNQFISTFSSFISQSPSFEYLEAIQETTVLALSHNDLTKLYGLSNKFEKLGRILAEKNYLCVLDRTHTMQTKTAKQKYLDFIENYDKIILQGVPQYHVASFLGITPESLSRVRKEISIS